MYMVNSGNFINLKSFFPDVKTAEAVVYPGVSLLHFVASIPTVQFTRQFVS
jgi:hypothetical protein